MKRPFIISLCSFFLVLSPITVKSMDSPPLVNWHDEPRFLIHRVNTQSKNFELFAVASTNTDIAFGSKYDSPIFVYKQVHHDVHEFAVNQSCDLLGLWIKGKTLIDKRNKILVCHLDGVENRFLEQHLLDKRPVGDHETYRLNFLEVDFILRDKALSTMPNASLRLPLQLDQTSMQFVAVNLLQVSGTIESKVSFVITLRIVDETITAESVVLKELDSTSEKRELIVP